MNQPSLSAIRRELRRVRRRGDARERRLLVEFGSQVAANPDATELELDEAIVALERARVLARSARSTGLVDFVRASAAKSLCLRSKRRGNRTAQYDEAISLTQEIRPIVATSNNPDELAMNYTNEALLRLERPGSTDRDTRRAHALLRQALTIRARERGSANWAFTQANLGLCLRRMPTRNFEQLQENLLAADAAYSESLLGFPEDSHAQQRGAALIGLAQTELELARLKQDLDILSYFTEMGVAPASFLTDPKDDAVAVLSICRLADQNPDIVDETEVADWLPRIPKDRCRYDEARLRRARKASEDAMVLFTTKTPNKAEWARSAAVWADAVEMEGWSTSPRTPEAIRLLEQCLDSLDVENSPEAVFRISRTLGLYRAGTADWQRAADVFETGVHANQLAFRDASLSQPAQRSLLEQAANIGRLAAFALAKVGRIERAVDVVEGTRVRSLNLAPLAAPRIAQLGTRDRPLLYVFTAPAGAVGLLTWTEDNDPRYEAIFCDLTGGQVMALLFRLSPSAMVGFLGDQLDPNRFPASLRDCATQLGSSLMQPITDALTRNGAKAVSVIPCGPLSLLPLGLARIDQGHADALLGEVFQLSFCPSAGLLARSLSVLREGEQQQLQVLALAPERLDLPTIGHAQVEAAVVARTHVGHATLVSGDDATCAAARQALAGDGVIHLACHGFSHSFRPNDSSLALSDGNLTVGSLWDAKLRARLVIASACQSGQSALFAVPDETLGLPTALMGAGVVCVVASLWPVNDYATSLLMSRFHELIHEGESAGQIPAWLPAAALQKCQRWLRELDQAQCDAYLLSRPALAEALRNLETTTPTTAEEPIPDFFGTTRGRPLTRHPFSDPVFWAPFIVIGP